MSTESLGLYVQRLLEQARALDVSMGDLIAEMHRFEHAMRQEGHAEFVFELFDDSDLHCLESAHEVIGDLRGVAIRWGRYRDLLVD